MTNWGGGKSKAADGIYDPNLTDLNRCDVSPAGALANMFYYFHMHRVVVPPRKYGNLLVKKDNQMQYMDFMEFMKNMRVFLPTRHLNIFSSFLRKWFYS